MANRKIRLRCLKRAGCDRRAGEILDPGMGQDPRERLGVVDRRARDGTFAIWACRAAQYATGIYVEDIFDLY